MFNPQRPDTHGPVSDHPEPDIAPPPPVVAVNVGGIVTTWDEPPGVSTILSDAGTIIVFTRATIRLLNPSQARRYPSLAAVSLKVGQRVRFDAIGAEATRVLIDPNAPHL
jgi:hypothetical protein